MRSFYSCIRIETKSILLLVSLIKDFNKGCVPCAAIIYANTGIKASHTFCEALLLLSLIGDFNKRGFLKISDKGY